MQPSKIGCDKSMYLEGHIAVVLEVVGKPNRGHPPRAELSVEAVSISQCGLKTC